MTEKEKDNFTNEKYIFYLENKIRKLEDEISAAEKELNSKRYIVINKTVNSLYKAKRAIIPSRKAKTANYEYLQYKEKISKSSSSKDVNIINFNFYDWDGVKRYKGGAERYVYDLAVLLNEMGYHAKILQCSNVPFTKKFKGVEVVGIGEGDVGDIKKCSLALKKHCENCRFIVASPLELAEYIDNIPIIGINHGINFDIDSNEYDSKDQLIKYKSYMRALNNVEKCVCVDTNFINWTRTIDYAVSLKEKYIPNYYEAADFIIGKKEEKFKNKIVFLYPRRIYSARGYDITIDAFDKLFEEYGDKIFLKFVGQIDNDEVKEKMDAFMKKYPKFVSREEFEMDEMYKAYQNTDVVLIPTRYSEGTSLSCIEAMGCEKAIIATTVGGLPNLVFNDYNGLLISPTASDLYNAAKKIIDNPQLIKKFGKNSLHLAENSLQKENWKENWKQVIKEVGGPID